MKVSGNLFRVAIKDLGVESNKIVHIGDNKRSDYEIPKQLHMDAVHVKKPLDVFFDNDIRARDFFEYNGNNINDIFEDLMQTIYTERRKIPDFKERDKELDNLTSINLRDKKNKNFVQDNECEC